jgi:serine/threonine protein kinase
VLARLQADASAHFGTPDVRLVPVTHHERPFSHVLRVAVCRGSSQPDLHLFVKVFKPKADVSVEAMRARIAQDYGITRRISDAMARWEDMGAVRPVACYLEELAIVTEQVPGQTLMAHLDAHARWFLSPARHRDLTGTLSTIGRWLRAFQSIEPAPGRVALADLRAYVDIRLERLALDGALSATERRRMLAHLDALAEQVTPASLAEVIIHSDLAPGNILVSGRRVVVIDFAMVARGSMLHDITRLYMQLEVLRTKPQFRSATVRAMQAALLQGFDETLTPDAPLFRYLLMLHRVNHFGSLSLNREPFLASVFSGRVRRLHRTWFERELATTFAEAQR